MRDAEWEWKSQRVLEEAERRAQEATGNVFRAQEEVAQAKAEVDTLRAENEALRKDAERWRFVNEHADQDYYWMIDLPLYREGVKSFIETVDEAIALQQQKEGQQ